MSSEYFVIFCSGLFGAKATNIALFTKGRIPWNKLKDAVSVPPALGRGVQEKTLQSLNHSSLATLVANFNEIFLGGKSEINSVLSMNVPKLSKNKEVTVEFFVDCFISAIVVAGKKYPSDSGASTLPKFAEETFLAAGKPNTVNFGNRVSAKFGITEIHSFEELKKACCSGIKASTQKFEVLNNTVSRSDTTFTFNRTSISSRLSNTFE